MDSKSLKAIKSFQTLDLSGVREFTCRFGNGPLGIQFGDGVRKDGESYEKLLKLTYINEANLAAAKRAVPGMKKALLKALKGGGKTEDAIKEFIKTLNGK